jgi:hypothetical protein
MIVLVRLLLVALAAGMIAMATVGSGGAPQAAGTASGRDVPIMPSPHIHLGEAHRPYNSLPPTSGPHYPDTVGTGVYREELPEEIQVHALEHGHVLIQYAPQLAAPAVRELERLGRRYLREVIVAPYRKLAPHARRGQPIALTAWARIDRLATVDAGRIAGFVRAFSGRYNHGSWHGGEPSPGARAVSPR